MSKRAERMKVFVCDPDPELASEISAFLPQALVEIEGNIERPEDVVRTLAHSPLCTALFGPGWATEVIFDSLNEAAGRGFLGGSVLLRRDYTSQMAEECRHAGMGGVLPVPVDAEDLMFALARAKKEGTQKKATSNTGTAKTMAVFSTKGGVGKSVVATNLAVGIASAAGSSYACSTSTCNSAMSVSCYNFSLRELSTI